MKFFGNQKGRFKMHFQKIFLIIYIFCSVPSFAKSKISELDSSGVLRVKVTSQAPNFQFPWITKKPVTTDILGIVVKKNAILVLGSFLEHATSIEVKFKELSSPVSAKIERVDLDANLALLSLEQEIPKAIKPVVFEDKFDPKSEFTLLNLDSLGNPLYSVARGISLNVEQQPNSHMELPVLNISCNEKLDGVGEVLFANNRLVGLLFKYQNNKNIGKVVPGFLINQFLEKEKEESSFAYMGFRYQPLVDKASKEYYNFPYEGVIVSEVIPYSSADGVLQVEDIIFQIEDFKIDAQGNFEHPDSNYGIQPISFLFHSGKELGFEIRNKLKIKVWRNKKETVVKMKLKPFPKKAIRIPHAHNYGSQPKFLISNGFIFTELSEFFLKEWGNNWRLRVDKKLLYLLDYHKFHKTRTQGRIILLVQVLPDDSNNGYHNLSLEILQSVNNKKIKSIKQLYESIYKSKEEVVVIELENGASVAIDVKNLNEIDQKIANKFNIPQLKNL